LVDGRLGGGRKLPCSMQHHTSCRAANVVRGSICGGALSGNPSTQAPGRGRGLPKTQRSGPHTASWVMGWGIVQYLEKRAAAEDSGLPAGQQLVLHAGGCECCLHSVQAPESAKWALFPVEIEAKASRSGFLLDLRVKKPGYPGTFSRRAGARHPLADGRRVAVGSGVPLSHLYPPARCLPPAPSRVPVGRRRCQLCRRGGHRRGGSTHHHGAAPAAAELAVPKPSSSVAAGGDSERFSGGDRDSPTRIVDGRRVGLRRGRWR